jgi:3-oxoacyl-[acyl-carrier-protein] synthase-1
MAEALFINGCGISTALGQGVEQNLLNLPQASKFLTSLDVGLSDDTLRVPYYMVAEPGRDAGPDRLRTIIDSVVSDAISEAGLSSEQVVRLGVFVGSTSFDVFGSEEFIRCADKITDDVISSSLTTFGCLASYIKQSLGIKGPEYTFNTACTASANALMYAADMLRAGEIEHALVVGLEFSNDVTTLGFHALELISQHGMRPFDSHRDGLYLGEGCGAIVISRHKTAENQFSFVSGANIGDTYSITSTEPEGATIAEVIDLAVKQAGINPSDIQAVKAHGTASLSNDEAESAGLRRYFGSAMPPVQVYKPMIGHTLGACGINELILFYHSIEQGLCVPYCDTAEFESDLGIALLTDFSGRQQGYYLLNYFGFGGNNTALVIANTL